MILKPLQNNGICQQAPLRWFTSSSLPLKPRGTGLKEEQSCSAVPGLGVKWAIQHAYTGGAGAAWGLICWGWWPRDGPAVPSQPLPPSSGRAAQTPHCGPVLVASQGFGCSGEVMVEAWRQNILWGPAEGSSVLTVLTRQAGGWLLPCNGSTWGGRSGGWRKANGKPRSHKRLFPRRPKLSWVQIPKALLSAHFTRPRACRCIWDVACGI